MRTDLPETCLATLPGQGSLIILKRGETGYYRSDWETGDKAKNQEIADFHNSRRGITPAQVEAMKAGSMFGFDVPGANPQVYFDEARFLSSSVLGVGAAIKDPGQSFPNSIKGNLYLYQVAGKKCAYVDVSSVPDTLFSKGSDYTIIPDMVAGKALVPVAVDFDSVIGIGGMELEHGSYSQGKEMNAGYEIIAKVCVGPVEYALGELDGKYPSFVTWERTPVNDGDGPPNYYWGHYFDNRDKAIQDFCGRAEEKFKMLSQDRKPSLREQLTAAKEALAEKPNTQRHHKDKEAR